MCHASLSPFHRHLGWVVTGIVLVSTASDSLNAQDAPSRQPLSAQLAIPDTWDEARLASLQVPLAHAGVSAKHVPKEYYSSLPVRPIYKSYDVYRPDLEPKGYFEWLKSQDPEVLWDGKKAPPLETEADWVKAGEFVFDSSLGWGTGSIMGPNMTMQVRDPQWYTYTQAPLTADGKLPYYRYVIRVKGRVEISRLSCAMCHTRVMSDKTVVKGAQGNFPFGKAAAYDTLKINDPERWARPMEILLYGAPWLRPDPLVNLEKKTVEGDCYWPRARSAWRARPARHWLLVAGPNPGPHRRSDPQVS
jgi:hypothetical protein